MPWILNSYCMFLIQFYWMPFAEKAITKSWKSIWHRPYIIWCLQGWWFWCVRSCQSFVAKSSNELYGNTINIKFHRSNGDWNSHRGEKSDIGWIFAFRINYECCRPCHCHSRLSRSSCSWYTLYKVKWFNLWILVQFLCMWTVPRYCGLNIAQNVILVTIFWRLYHAFDVSGTS